MTRPRRRSPGTTRPRLRPRVARRSSSASRRSAAPSLAELARDYAVSAITVHRDLNHLAREGLVERFHGGARAISGARSGGTETAWERRLRRSGPAKDAIGAYARASIVDGATIFLDASSTCLALAHRLDLEPPEEITVVTNSPAIALGLESSVVRVVIVPGEVDLRMRAIADGWTVEFLHRVNLTRRSSRERAWISITA